MKRLEGKTAVVTGSGQGIGRAIAMAYAAEGANVAVFDIEPKGARDTAEAIANAGGSVQIYVVDLSDRSAAQAAIESVVVRFGGLDILVNNAIWTRFESIPEITEYAVLRMLGSGLKSTIWCIQGAERHLKSGGVIINLSSVAGELGAPNTLVYSGIKAAAAAMTRAAAAELGPRGIRVVGITPGSIKTPGALQVIDDAGYELRLRKIPLGRIGEPSDVARAAVFLASDEADYISGDVLRVDGGVATAFL
jgi:NAD(P)-dependent dehydrogenase (short-subunit alcohol dehydrogenase family)